MKVCCVQDSEGNSHGCSAAQNGVIWKMSKQTKQNVDQEKDAFRMLRV